MGSLINVFEAFIYPFASRSIAMEGRRWEDLGEDCLINVFGRLGLKDKTLGVPFVCKSWYKASLNPLCWRVLNFHQLCDPQYVTSWGFFGWRFRRECRLEGRFFSGLLRFVVARSDGLALELILPQNDISFADMVYVSDKCPALKVLVLPDLPKNSAISTLISKWKDLERLYLRRNHGLKEILLEISRNCENLTSFQMNGISIDKEVAYILTELPKLKYLCLSGSRIEKDSLMVILKGCKGLEELYLRNVNYFDDEVLTVDDEEVVTEASSIKTFKYAKLLPPLDCHNEYPYNLLEYGGILYMALSIKARIQQLKEEEEKKEEENRRIGRYWVRGFY